jgi:methionyl-tRNA formyltransferase
MANMFMGHYDIVLGELLKNITIDLVFVEDKPANAKVKNMCKDHNIRCVVVSTSEDIMKAANGLGRIDLCVVASFGIILKNMFIESCGQVVNFHAGDITACRGRHPLPAAILNGHTTMALTTHLIDSEEIDAGPIVAKVLLPIDYAKSYRYNEFRLLELLGPLAGLLMKDYVKYSRFVTCAWDKKRSIYYRPLDKKTLDSIMSADTLKGWAK